MVHTKKTTTSKKKQPPSAEVNQQQRLNPMGLAQSRYWLEAAYRQYTDLYDFAPVGYFILTRSGAICQVNFAGANLLGVDHAQAIHMRLAAFLTKEALPSFNLFFEKLLSGEGKTTCELTFEKNGNELLWAHLEATCFEGGEISRAMLTNITERKRMEQTLQESENRFRMLLQDVSTIAVQGYATDGTTQYWNSASEKLYGYSAREAIGKNLLDLIIPPEMQSDARSAIQQMAETGEAIPAAELLLMRKDGSRVNVYSSHAIVSIPGRAPELFCLDVDLTERKRTASLLQARVQISEFAESHTLDELLQKMLDEAEALTDSQIGFAHFLEADQKTLRLQTWSTNTLKNMCSAESRGSHYSVEQAGVWADCVAARAPVIHNDYANLPASRRKGLPQGHAPILRELVVPILRNDLIVMILGVGNKITNYDEKDIEIVSQLANSTWDIIQHKRVEDALKKSEKKYRLLHESIIDGFVSVDMNGNFLDCNEIYRNMLGYSQTELAQLTYFDLTPEKWREFEADIVKDQILKRGYSDIYEKEYIRKDGSIFAAELHTVLLRDEQGNPIGMWAIVRDITERKQAEQALRESQQLFMLFMRHSPIYTFIKEVAPTQSRVLQASENYLNMIGIAGHDMMGRSMEELFPPEIAAKITADDWAVISSGKALEMDEDMNDRHYTTIKFPIIQGDKTLLAGYTIDITERVRAETALKDSEFFVKSVLNSLTAHIAVLNDQGVIIAVNEAWIKFARENNSQHATDYVGVNYLSACQSSIQQGDPIAQQADQGIRAVMDGDQPQFSLEYPCHSPNQQRWFIITALPMRQSHQGVVVIHQDITESKRAELELQYMKASFESANVDLKTALARQSQLAHTDALTGINNRRYLYEIAEHEFDIAARYQQPLSAIMFDLDHFKEVNDTFGHATGDQILQRVTQSACAELRSTDVIGRYGGEEFVIILPVTTAEQAYPLAERIRTSVAAIREPTEKGFAAVTLSIGIVEINHSHQTTSIEDLIRRADKAMYAAKQAGRNRTEIGGG